MASYHAAKRLAMGFLVEEGEGGGAPLVTFTDVVEEGGGCDGFTDGSAIPSVDGFPRDMQLSLVGCDARDGGPV